MTSQHIRTVGSFRRFGYGAPVGRFLAASAEEVVGHLTGNSSFDVDQTQVHAWQGTIEVLQAALKPFGTRGHLFLEFDIPRMGRRVDAVLVLDHVVFVIEFKVGARQFSAADLDQVVDYALDLKNFHEPSHHAPLVPVLVATHAPPGELCIATDSAADGLYAPVRVNADTLTHALEQSLAFADGEAIDPQQWVTGRYRPTPTIVEAAMALYARHSVADISRNDAANLGETSGFLAGVIWLEVEKGVRFI